MIVLESLELLHMMCTRHPYIRVNFSLQATATTRQRRLRIAIAMLVTTAIQHNNLSCLVSVCSGFETKVQETSVFLNWLYTQHTQLLESQTLIPSQDSQMLSYVKMTVQQSFANQPPPSCISYSNHYPWHNSSFLWVYNHNWLNSHCHIIPVSAFRVHH